MFDATNRSSVFGQNHAFGSIPSQTSPSGSTFQQTQSTFRSNLCGSSPSFGGPSRPTFGYTTTSTPAFGIMSDFGAISTPAFGATSTPAFGSTNTPAFASSASAFGSTSSTFGQSRAPAFGSGGAFGTTTTRAFGAPNASALGAPSNAFSASTSGFGDSRVPSFNFGSCPFGESNSSFGSSPFGTTPLPFGAQSSPFGSQAATSAFDSPAFWQSSFGGRCEGSRVTSYHPTIDIGDCGKLESISAMLAYKNESHEELRWEDYRSGDKGGPSTAAQPAGGMGTGTPAAQPNPFEISSIFAQFSTNSFSYTSSSSPVTSTFESISAMPADIDKSHEEFRWEDYKSGNKGGRSCVAHPAGPGGMGFGTPAAQPSPFGSSSCSICWSEPKEGVCVPCGHVTACLSCLNRIQNRKCPICRSRIQQVIRIFIA